MSVNSFKESTVTMPITTLMINEGAAIYYSDAWHRLIEDHLLYLINHPDVTTTIVTNGDAFKWEGDFYGLLAAYNVQAQYHWIALRLNGLTSPMDYKSTMTTLKLPPIRVVETLRAVFQTSYQKIN